MLSCFQIELGHAVLRPNKNDLRGINPLNVGRDPNWLFGVDDFDRVRPFGKINHEQLLVVDVLMVESAGDFVDWTTELPNHIPKLMAFFGVIRTFPQVALRMVVRLAEG